MRKLESSIKKDAASRRSTPNGRHINERQLKYMTGQVAKGTMTRREFVGRAAALGVTAAVANSMLANAAADAHEARSGVASLKIGSSGGETTNTHDPALTASEVPLNNLRHWGETLVEVDPTARSTPAWPKALKPPPMPRHGRSRSAKASSSPTAKT